MEIESDAKRTSEVERGDEKGKKILEISVLCPFLTNEPCWTIPLKVAIGKSAWAVRLVNAEMRLGTQIVHQPQFRDR